MWYVSKYVYQGSEYYEILQYSGRYAQVTVAVCQDYESAQAARRLLES